LLFENFTVPKNATISNAGINFDWGLAAAGQGTPVTLNARIIGYDADNADAAGTTGPWALPTDVGSANRTSAVTANFLVATAQAGTTLYDGPSPQLSTIIQEIVNRAGWNAGNNMILFLEVSGATDGGGSLEQVGVNVNGLTCTLQVHYT
jgi:hypothetical protein